jgi:hypothetical protein
MKAILLLTFNRNINRQNVLQNAHRSDEDKLEQHSKEGERLNQEDKKDDATEGIENTQSFFCRVLFLLWQLLYML